DERLAGTIATSRGTHGPDIIGGNRGNAVEPVAGRCGDLWIGDDAPPAAVPVLDDGPLHVKGVYSVTNGPHVIGGDGRHVLESGAAPDAVVGAGHDAPRGDAANRRRGDRCGDAGPARLRGASRPGEDSGWACKGGVRGQ